MPKFEVCVHKKTGRVGAIFPIDAPGDWSKREKAEFDIQEVELTQEQMRDLRQGKKRVVGGKVEEVPEADWPKRPQHTRGGGALTPDVIRKIRDGVVSGKITEDAIGALVDGKIKKGKKTGEPYIPRGMQDPRPGI